MISLNGFSDPNMVKREVWYPSNLEAGRQPGEHTSILPKVQNTKSTLFKMTVWDGIFQEVRTQKEQRGHEIPNM